MTTRAIALIGLLCLGTAGGLACMPAAQARTYVDIGIRMAPPAPRYEAVVVRPGYAWTPGYWRWNGRYHRHDWVGGTYVVARPGYAWRAQRWDRDHDGRWRFREGGWYRGHDYGHDHDHDHDHDHNH